VHLAHEQYFLVPEMFVQAMAWHFLALERRSMR